MRVLAILGMRVGRVAAAPLRVVPVGAELPRARLPAHHVAVVVLPKVPLVPLGALRLRLRPPPPLLHLPLLLLRRLVHIRLLLVGAVLFLLPLPLYRRDLLLRPGRVVRPFPFHVLSH